MSMGLSKTTPVDRILDAVRKLCRPHEVDVTYSLTGATTFILRPFRNQWFIAYSLDDTVLACFDSADGITALASQLRYEAQAHAEDLISRGVSIDWTDVWKQDNTGRDATGGG